jgi:signal transduction histidine kinase
VWKEQSREHKLSAGWLLPRRAPPQSSRDHQVDDQKQVAFECQDDPFSHPSYTLDPPADDIRDRRVGRPQHEDVADLDSIDGLADHAWREALEVDGDVGKLGHEKNAAACGLRPAAPAAREATLYQEWRPDGSAAARRPQPGGVVRSSFPQHCPVAYLGVKAFRLPRTSPRDDGAPRAPLPPIARELAWTEWLAVAGVWLALALTSVGTLTDTARRAGIGVVFHDFFVIQIVDWLAWMTLIWPLFAALDATPIVPPRRVAHALARFALWPGVAAVHAALAYPTLVALSGPLGLSGEVWQASAATPLGAFFDDLANAAVPFTAYALLRRSHRRRHELARAADLERSLLKARLHALDLELRPHFLFNTLNAITALVHSEPAQAERMLITLGSLLRVTLGRTGGEVTVEEELDQLDLYLDIQRVRFRDRLDVRIEVDADVLQAYVPGMILQPLVENALTHGLAPKISAGTVKVAVERDGDMVVLRVADDGVGLPAGGPRERTGVGNTRERLRALYGGAYSFTLSPIPSGGTMSEARIPFRVAPMRTAEFPIGTAVQQTPPSAKRAAAG